MTTTTAIQGTCKDGFQRVKEAFEDNFANHGEVGASLALMVDGEMVVDVWGGYADAGRTRPWERDTIVNTFSTTKGMVAICANRLIEQGLLDPDAPVAKYWPEFAQAGKENLPVRMLLNHQAGLCCLDDIIARENGFRWEPYVEALAAQKPWWEPGTKFGYHAVTFGHLVGEVIRRITGVTVGAYFRKEIAEPLGIDFHIGFGPELDSRCADMIPTPLTELRLSGPVAEAMMNPQSLTFKSFMITPEPMLNPGYMNMRDWRAAEVPSANGHGNARALATVYGALALGGELNGIRILQEETIADATSEQSYGIDEVLLIPMRFGRGFILDVPEYQLTPSSGLFGHSGLGGSFGFADPNARIGIGYAMNKMVVPEDLLDERWVGIFAAVYDSVS